MKRFSLLIFLFLTLSARAQDAYFNWVRKMEFYAVGTFGYFVDTDKAGNVYLAGMFQNSADLDPGPGVQEVHCSTNGNGALFVSKFSPDGTLVWSRSFCSGPSSEVSALAVDSAGNAFITGHFTGTMDADPGPGTFLLDAPLNTGTENHDVFVIKLNSQGDFGWAVRLGGRNADWGHGVAVDRQGNVLLTGYFTGSTDFDPGPDSTVLGSNGRVSSFIWKLSAIGNLVWAHALTGYHTYGSRITTDESGNVYANGTFDGTIDLDPGPNIATFGTTFNSSQSYLVKLTAGGAYLWGTDQIPVGDIAVDISQQIVVYNGSLAKYSSSGNLLWRVQPAGRSYTIGYQGHHQLALDRAGNIFFTGIYEDVYDFDPGPGNFTLPHTNPGNSSDVFLCRFSPDGKFVWAKGWGNFGPDAGLSLALDTTGNIYTSGIFIATVDFDPGPGTHTETVWPQACYLLKLGACAQNSYRTLDVTTCNAYTLNGTLYSESGTYVQTLLNATGCDSVITLRLEVQRTYTEVAAIACSTYVWNGRTLTAGGTYYDTLTTTAGCDSIVQLHLNIRQPVASTVTATICEGSSLTGYSSTGIYTDVFTAANGCDSVRTLHLTVTPRVHTTVQRTLCAGETYEGYGSAGTFIDNLRSAAGCDSIRTLHLVVLPAYRDTSTRSICEGESYLGHIVNGTYTDRLQSRAGCDSLVTTFLSVIPLPRPTLPPDTTICLGTTLMLQATGGGPYRWQDGSTADTYLVNKEGIYTVTSTNACGSSYDAIRIVITPCTPYFPSAFSPNGDGRNDRFGMLQSWLVKNYRLTVYNRWGQPVFSTTNPSATWDGTFRGVQQETGAFIWHSTFTVGGEVRSEKGSVLLVR